MQRPMHRLWFLPQSQLLHPGPSPAYRRPIYLQSRGCLLFRLRRFQASPSNQAPLQQTRRSDAPHRQRAWWYQHYSQKTTAFLHPLRASHPSSLRKNYYPLLIYRFQGCCRDPDACKRGYPDTFRPPLQSNGAVQYRWHKRGHPGWLAE